MLIRDIAEAAEARMDARGQVGNLPSESDDGTSGKYLLLEAQDEIKQLFDYFSTTKQDSETHIYFSEVKDIYEQIGKLSLFFDLA